MLVNYHVATLTNVTATTGNYAQAEKANAAKATGAIDHPTWVNNHVLLGIAKQGIHVEHHEWQFGPNLIFMS